MGQIFSSFQMTPRSNLYLKLDVFMVCLPYYHFSICVSLIHLAVVEIAKNNELAKVEESKYLKGIRFDTNLVEDRHISTFLENYVALRLNKHKEEPREISFCFRWQFYSMVGQCFFQETSIGIFFKKPDVHRVGYVLFYGAYVMFSVPKGIKFVPMVWHHICVSYKDYHVVIVMDGVILLNKTQTDVPPSNI